MDLVDNEVAEAAATVEENSVPFVVSNKHLHKYTPYIFEASGPLQHVPGDDHKQSARQTPANVIRWLYRRRDTEVPK
ncbi:hypothetical protein CGMCC3_g18135 [Colletotrichum fructicola]|nr:uncharacterized protein CGMCC3_g18135 [Colletotrichum fructicola]KAE9565680.1 hypothetical protein CGMCC3_g18135 [Colletotrichum fructicola]